MQETNCVRIHLTCRSVIKCSVIRQSKGEEHVGRPLEFANLNDPALAKCTSDHQCAPFTCHCSSNVYGIGGRAGQESRTLERFSATFVWHTVEFRVRNGRTSFKFE
eukprot:scpid99817/ scgid9077/ 